MKKYIVFFVYPILLSIVVTTSFVISFYIHRKDIPIALTTAYSKKVDNISVSKIQNNFYPLMSLEKVILSLEGEKKYKISSFVFYKNKIFLFFQDNNFSISLESYKDTEEKTWKIHGISHIPNTETVKDITQIDDVNFLMLGNKELYRVFFDEKNKIRIKSIYYSVNVNDNVSNIAVQENRIYLYNRADGTVTESSYPFFQDTRIPLLPYTHTQKTEKYNMSVCINSNYTIETKKDKDKYLLKIKNANKEEYNIISTKEEIIDISCHYDSEDNKINIAMGMGKNKDINNIVFASVNELPIT